jgi:hypothetical protein
LWWQFTACSPRVKGPDVLAEHRQHRVHHQPAVGGGVGLGPLDRGDVVVEVLAALAQVRQVLVGQLLDRAPHVALGQLDEVVPMRLPTPRDPECSMPRPDAPRRGRPR